MRGKKKKSAKFAPKVHESSAAIRQVLDDEAVGKKMFHVAAAAATVKP